MALVEETHNNANWTDDERQALARLSDGVRTCMNDDAAATDCPLYDEGEPFNCGKDRAVRELLNASADKYVRKDHAPGDTSDGFHTFDELYEHRTVLFACLCNTYQDVNGQEGVTFRSRKHHDGTMYDGFFIVGLNTGEGWVTYHCEDRFWHYFGRVPETESAPKWDGATPDHGLSRLYDMFIECWRVQ